MNIRKILFLALATSGLVFTSCSMNKDGMNTASLQSGRLQAGQQLTVQQSKNHEKMAAINVPVYQNDNQTRIPDVIGNAGRVQLPMHPRGLKALARNQFAGAVGKSLAQITALPKLMSPVTQLMKMPTHSASQKSNPFEGMNYLLMWIIFLVASILLYFIGGQFAAASILALVFNLLGLIAGLFFLLFLILWIVQIYKAGQK